MFRRWDNMSARNRIGTIAIVLLVIGFLFWIPFTRAAILYILPLGSGLDDIIFIGALAIGGILLVIRAIAGKKMS